MSFLGCLQKPFILFIQNNLLKRTMALWSPKKKKENCACLCLSPQLISSKYGVMFNKPLQRKIRTSTSTPSHQYSINIQPVEKVQLIECFHSRGQHVCKFVVSKESVCIRKEFNSQGNGLGHQHGRRFIVLGHQYGRRDVMCELWSRHESVT